MNTKSVAKPAVDRTLLTMEVERVVKGLQSYAKQIGQKEFSSQAHMELAFKLESSANDLRQKVTGLLGIVGDLTEENVNLRASSRILSERLDAALGKRLLNQD